MSSPTVTFVGAKGGVGTSTIAALHAIQLARLGRTVRLSANDGVDDLAAIVGVPCPGPDETANVLPGLTLGEERCTEPTPSTSSTPAPTASPTTKARTCT